MYRGTVYGIAVLALIVNTLTPKTIDTNIPVPCEALAANSCFVQNGNSERVEYPRSTQQLRASSRVFSCPLPLDDADSHCVLPEVPSLQEEPSVVSRDFAYDGRMRDSSSLLRFQCRLNI